MDQIEWLPYDDEAHRNIDKDYVYYIRTSNETEHSGMWPNYAGFHCVNPGQGLRVSMSDVTHYAIQMTFDDHADKFVFNRG